MKKPFLILMIFVANACFCKFNAQNISLLKDTINGKVMAIEMDSRVEELLNDLSDDCKTNSHDFTTPKTKNPSVRSSEITSTSLPSIKKPLTQYEICKQNPRMQGYKIQVTLAKSADEAQKIRQFIRNRLPDLKVEIDGSLRPNYKILAGSYFSKQSAAVDIKRLRAYFDSPVPLSWRVFCVESK